MAAKSKVKLNYELPDEVVEDYTYEMGRLKFKVSEKKYPAYKSVCFVVPGVLSIRPQPRRLKSYF